MATSWNDADITALETAIKRGVLRVKFADREVQYHSITEMLKLLTTMRDAVAVESSSVSARTTYAKFRKGPA